MPVIRRTSEKTSFSPTRQPSVMTELEKRRNLLCSRCGLLNLSKALSKQPTELNGTGVANLSESVLLSSSATCQLCQLLDAVRPVTSGTSGVPVQLRAFSTSLTYGNDLSMLKFLNTIAQKTFLSVAWQPDSAHSGQFVRYPLTDTGCIVKLRNINAHNVLEASEIDLSLLKTWVEVCCKTHANTCTKQAESEHVAGMRVIDVWSRAVVPATPHFDYAALSYVWGAGEQADCDYLPDPAPKTIEDALEVARRLEIPYLWVDRYCIRQHDKHEKHVQISKMHLIYRNARVTIIAAAGTGPHHGIPGIGGTPRAPQPHAILRKSLLAAIRPHPTATIKQSKWGSRGWTYQETALSTRRLAFTESQVYFECNGFEQSEGIDEPIRQLASTQSRVLQPRLCGGLSALRGNQRKSHDIWWHISEVSGRHISYEEDRVNVILGVLADFERSNHLSGHLWGVPIFSNSTTAGFVNPPRNQTEGFLTGMMWDMQEPAERNSRFPSWSWAGWRNTVNRQMKWGLKVMNAPAGSANFVRIWIELQNGQLLNIENFQGATETSEPSHYIHLEALVIKCRFKYTKSDRLGMSWIPVLEDDGEENSFEYSPFVLTQRPSAVTGLEKRVALETWDAIPWQTRAGDVYFLVIHWFPTHAERLGYFVMEVGWSHRPNIVFGENGMEKYLHWSPDSYSRIFAEKSIIRLA